jgi:hypothetical protein
MTFREFNRIAEISSSASLKTTMGACGLRSVRLWRSKRLSGQFVPAHGAEMHGGFKSPKSLSCLS